MSIYLMSCGFVLFLNSIIYFAPVGRKIKEKGYLFVSATILIILYGARGASVGVDTQTYLSMFSTISGLSIEGIWGYWTEIGYTIYNKLIFLIFNDRQILLLISGLIIVGGTVYFIAKTSKYKILSLYLYITFMFYFSAMNAMRQFIAISIIYIAYIEIKAKKNKNFIGLILIASLFHESALIFFIIFFIKNIKFTLIKAFKILIIFYILINSGLVDFIISKSSFRGYMGGVWYGEGNYLHFIMYTTILIFCFLINKKSSDSQSENLLLWCVFFAVLFQLAATKIRIFVRIANYFMPFSIILIPNILYKIKILKTRRLYKFIIIILAMIYSSLYCMKGAQGAIPYEFFM